LEKFITLYKTLSLYICKYIVLLKEDNKFCVTYMNTLQSFIDDLELYYSLEIFRNSRIMSRSIISIRKLKLSVR